MIRAIIFDFGGVLLRTGDPVGRREWEQRLGLPAGRLEQIVHGSAAWLEAQRGAISPDAYWIQVADTLNIPPEDLPALQHDYFREDLLDTSLMALAASYRARGYWLGLLSNDSVTLEGKLRDTYRIDQAFDAIVISAKVGVLKPDSAAYQAILDALKASPQEAIFIDDNAANVEGARRVGMHALHYQAGMDVQAALEAIIHAAIIGSP
ncbi:MAG TPA: HAD family phosphatase [Aggregatilineales bacterium]|nr:HAD family phosphatase [Aggregatilineales bacterium]